jgi:hypothetical protein
MKKTFFFFLIIFFLTVKMNAQQKYDDNSTRAKSYTEAKRSIDKEEVPKAVIDSFNNTNKDIPIKAINIYHYFKDLQAQYFDFHGYEDTLSQYTPDPLIPVYYELAYVKNHHKYKSVYSKDGTLLFTSRIIKDKELPKAVAMAFRKSEYSDWDIVGEKEKINKKNPDENIYKLKVKKGIDTHVLRYYPNGLPVK